MRFTFFAVLPLIGLSLVYPPQPDLRLSVALRPSELQEFRDLLRKFASAENLTVVQQHVPRASGKLFFLALESRSIAIIAEESSGDAPMVVEFTDINSDSPNVLRIEDGLTTLLRRRWPELRMRYHQGLK